MSRIPARLRREVIARAAGRCEYCLRPELITLYSHEVDHIIALKHGGETIEANLCLCCAHCNRYKSSDLASVDPETGEIALIFHPRLDHWDDHFRLNDALIEGITPKGRATARLLHFNDDEQVALRSALIALGRYP